MDNLLSAFGLTAQQSRILFSLECFMTNQDTLQDEALIDKINPFVVEHSKKEQWLDKYISNLNLFLEKETGSNDNANKVILAADKIKEAIKFEASKSESNTWKYLILLECTLFTPYFPFTEEDKKKNTYRGLTISKNVRMEVLKRISGWLNLDFDLVEKFLNQYEKITKKMTGYWNKVFIGVGAGLVAAILAVFTAGSSIAAFFAAEGLYGAAAISSGLAALGGGAVAAGGFGIVGGIRVLTGGSILLGSGAGATLAMALATSSPEGLMRETAKLFVVLKEIVLAEQHDMVRAQEIIGSVVDKIAELKKEITNLKILQEQNKEKIKNLEKSIKYLEDFLNMAS